MNWVKHLLASVMLVLISQYTLALELSTDRLMQYQSDFEQSQQWLDLLLTDHPDPNPTFIDLNLQKAQLYMLFQRADLLAPLLNQLQIPIFEQGSKAEQSQWHLFKGIQLYLVGQYTEADEQFSRSLHQFEQVENYNNALYLQSFIQMYQAVNRIYLQQYDESLNELSGLFKRAEKNNWPIIQARSLVFIGDVNYSLKNYEQALEYYQNAYGTYPQDAEIYRAEALMYEAQMINVVGERSEAFAKLESAIETLNKMGDHSRLANAFLLKSYFYSKVPDNAKALAWIAQSVEKREQLGNPIDIANAYVHYSSQLGTDNQLALALTYAKKAADLAEIHEDISGQWDSYANYAVLLNQAEQYQQAYHYMRLSERALLKKARLDITSQTATLNAQFNLRREQLKSEYLDKQGHLLEERNRLLNEQLLMKQQQQQQQQWLLLLVSIGLIFFLGLCMVIYRLYIKNKALASRDVLTNIHNRRSIMQLGEQALATGDRYQYALSVLMLDIDSFKAINDTHGHEMGDKVIQYVADMCTTTIRKPDYVGRIGGEEFLLILPHTNEDAALLLADRLCQQMVLDKAPHLEQVKQVTVSIGIATKDKHSELAYNSAADKDLSQLIREADTALYAAKERGRDQVQAYHENIQLKGQRVDIEGTMPHVLRQVT